VDLVQDLAPHSPEAELVIEGIRMDAPGEILANKLCALLSRSELRDLVDVRALEGAGLRVEDALATAHAKDGGLTPSQLAWVLSQWRIGDDARVPDGASPAALRTWLAQLCERLSRLAWPLG